MMTRVLVIALAVASLTGTPHGQPSSTNAPAFVAFYWRAKPGKLAEYNEYI